MKKLSDIIDKFYLEEKKDRIQTRFYISEAAKCPRQVYLKFKGAPQEKLDPNFLRLFDQGDHLHRLIMRPIFLSKGLQVVASEVDIPPQGLVSGRADAIIKLDNELCVLDIKSMNSMFFKKMSEPKEDNIKQLQLYLHYFQIQKGILLYVSKDNLELKEFAIDYDRKMAEQLISELEMLRGRIDSNAVPDRLADYPKNWQCRYCRLKKSCDSEILQKKDNPK